MMTAHTPEGDDLKAQRLADYSDAVARGERPDPEGIDPVDAALIRDLHALRKDTTPDPQMIARLRSRFAEQVAAEQARAQVEQREENSIPRPFPRLVPAPSGQTASGSTRVDGPAHSQPPGNVQLLPTELPDGKTRRVWWRPQLVAIAATLLLFLTAAGGLLYLAANRDDDVDPTVQAAAQSTESAAQTATSANADRVLTENQLTGVTQPFLLFEPFRENSTVGKGTPISVAFGTVTKTIPWDGAGVVILSGCPDRPCEYSIDDEIHLEVTRSDGTSRWANFRPNHWPGGLPSSFSVYVTEMFGDGDNSVNAVLYDVQGDKRGLMTPIYIVIIQ
jgi:hypothetical protein